MDAMIAGKNEDDRVPAVRVEPDEGRAAKTATTAKTLRDTYAGYAAATPKTESGQSRSPQRITRREVV